MNWKWMTVFLCLPLLVESGAFAVKRYDLVRSFSRPSRPHAVIPTPVELAPQELDKVVLARFEIGNVGAVSLAVSDLRAGGGPVDVIPIGREDE